MDLKSDFPKSSPYASFRELFQLFSLKLEDLDTVDFCLSLPDHKIFYVDTQLFERLKEVLSFDVISDLEAKIPCFFLIYLKESDNTSFNALSLAQQNLFLTLLQNLDLSENTLLSQRILFLSSDFLFFQKDKKSNLAFDFLELLGLSEKRQAKRLFYVLLNTIFHRGSPWGSLTGIRPSYIALEIYSALENLGLGKELCYDYSTLALQFVYGLREDKSKLALDAALAEQWTLKKAQKELQEEDLSAIYLSIPFCPTRCAYCSFSPRDGIKAQEALISDYLDMLAEDYIELSNLLYEKGKIFSALYIGGGTPAAPSTAQLRVFLEKISKTVLWDIFKEKTIEAGRVDCLDEEKLRCFKEFGFTRICINPQTMNPLTLKRLGRTASPDEVRDIFQKARAIGFQSINMDLIAALPGETSVDLINSVSELIRMGADSITLHCLALKRKSALGLMMRGLDSALPQYITEDYSANLSELMEKKLQLSAEALDIGIVQAQNLLRASGYYPAYLYRQKEMLGGHENLAWVKKGHDCLYNVLMMADAGTVLAFGTGSMSKWKIGKKILRLSNLASVDESMKRRKEMAEKRRAFCLENLD